VSVNFMQLSRVSRLVLAVLGLTAAAIPALAQTPAPTAPPVAAPPATAPAAAAIEVPVGYTIGPDDVLNVMFWRDKEMSADVVVRPDGRITLPLVNDVVAVGLTPEQLRDRIKEEASKYVEDPSVTVIVRQINSRRVFITGMVGKPGAYPMTRTITVLQLISIAGGLHEYADAKNIMIMRKEEGQQVALKFNYNDVRKGKNLKQNIELRSGDTVVVP
jgi:polysaccharide export outer membrane protein